MFSSDPAWPPSLKVWIYLGTYFEPVCFALQLAEIIPDGHDRVVFDGEIVLVDMCGKPPVTQTSFESYESHQHVIDFFPTETRTLLRHAVRASCAAIPDRLPATF